MDNFTSSELKTIKEEILSKLPKGAHIIGLQVVRLIGDYYIAQYQAADKSAA